MSCCIRWRRATILLRLKCDVEMGGTDQKFNLLVGPRATARLWPAAADRRDGTDTRRPGRLRENVEIAKGNYIGITEPPKVMFRKIMQISDELMYRYYELLTDLQERRSPRFATLSQRANGIR